jgi:hypothetical protein
MRIPIRIMGVATTFLWIFLAVFFVSAVYSVKDLHFDFGEPQTGLTVDNEIVFSLPMTIANNGFYNIGNFNVTTEISEEDFAIANATTFIPVIEKGNTVTITHNMTINSASLLENNQNCLFNDTELKIYAVVSMRIAEMIPVQASTNISMPFGAPLHNFTIGKPEYSHFNLTHVMVVLPINFENHAFFDVAGNMQIRMYNNASALIGEGQTAIEAPQNSSYSGVVEFYVQTSDITTNGFFEVDINTSLFNCEGLRFPYG